MTNEQDPQSSGPPQSGHPYLIYETAAGRTNQEYHALLHAVVEGIPDAVFVKDRQGRYLMINSAGARFLGKSVEEVLGKDDRELFTPETALPSMEDDRRIMATAETKTHERAGTAAGVTRAYLTTIGPYRDQAGHLAGTFGIARDITASKALQAERDRLVDQLRLQIDRLPLAYILLDAGNRVLDWNPAAEKMFGYTKEEMRGRVALNVLVPLPARDQVQEIIRRIQAGDMEAHSVNENRTKDGRTIMCEWFNTPLRDPDGRFAGFISLAQDITERKQADEAIRQMAAIVESSDDAIIGKTLDGIIVSWNRGAERMYGYAAEEVKGRSIFLLAPNNHADELAHILAELRQERGIDHYETVRKTKDGRLIDVSLTISPIRNRDGEITGASTIARDITERRQAEEQIRENEQKFQQLARNIEGYFWLNSPDNSQMYYMSPGYEKITGRSCADLYQRPESWTEIIHPEDRERVLALAGEPLRTEARQLEYRIVRSDGTVRWVRDRAFPVRDSSGQVYRVAGIGEDMTERKQAEDTLKENAARLQALSRRLVEVQEEERRRLARELHDGICQSLTKVAFAFEMGAAALPKMYGAKLAPARALLDEALNQVRELSLDLRPAMLDHLGLLPAIVWLLERFTARTFVQVHFRHEGLDARFAPLTETTAFRLVQEALSNVARHAGVKEVSVRIWVQEGWLNLQIEDEGAGFDPEAVLASTATSGLAGMREQVQLLDGKLTIDAAPGEGTHLLAQLPLELGPWRASHAPFRFPGR